VPFLLNCEDAFTKLLKRIIWLYDINCKYKVNVYERCNNNRFAPLSEKYHENLRDEKHLNYYVNVWHGFTHKPECADKHSLRNAEHVGMVTGEEIETGWSSLNHIQYSIREMDAGARQDAITIHMIHLNSRKAKNLGVLSMV
jgi:hypothetical protein